MVDIKWNKNFGKVPKVKVDAANRNIKKIVESNKTIDQKAAAIEKEFATAYKGTGLDQITNVVNKKMIKDMLNKGQVPTVSDESPMG